MLFTVSFWKATGERVVASFAGGVLAGVGVGVDWHKVLLAGGIAAAFSLLKALAAAGTGGGPSLTNAETLQ